MNIETQYHCQPWRDGKNSRFKIPIKERRQFDDKKPKELESEFDGFDVHG